uniref:AIG1-type G domain-containing protein n=1 Tax=Neogobius melanostomus TaxID=47308 RepID=A0A8C6TAF7_9GOBI
TDHRNLFNGDPSPELRLLLLGNISCGKTSSADTILNQQAPVSLSTSRGLVQRQGLSDGRRVNVVEAPRWYWSEPSGLSQLIARFNGRCHVINNRRRQDRMQVRELLDKVHTQYIRIARPIGLFSHGF